MTTKDIWIEHVHLLQNDICSAIEMEDGKARFEEDLWERQEGGGGKTRIITNGNVFEKGGVNTSIVYGKVTATMGEQLKIKGESWFACGISFVLHPHNPFVPTVHGNYRMFELYNDHEDIIDTWFGGGTDLTPYYLFKEDAIHFHQTYKNVCDKFDKTFYPEFKKNCDNYFVNWHRNQERRGIGGIFYDYKRPDQNKNAEFWINFAASCGNAFKDAYLEIVQRRKNLTFNEDQKRWQEIRRGRYTEFNLIHDRGTLFGLKTNGRIESILMSLPPTVRFEYNFKPRSGSKEDELLQACLHPVNWINII